MRVKVGVEKECLIFDQDYNPVDLDIDNLGDEMIVDFANHQLEIVTSVGESALMQSKRISNLLSKEYFSNKLIWPLSTPLEKNENVLHNKMDEAYRNSLADKYGIDKMLYSGIHFNYSNNYLQTEEEYFKLIQSTISYLPIIMQFTSYSPYAHTNLGELDKIGKNYGFKDSISLRASDRYGFSNDGDAKLDFQTYEGFLKSKLEAIEIHGLMDEREIYSKLRLKRAGNKNYIELRFLDLNPFIPAGVSDETLVFIESCLSSLSTSPVTNFDYSVSEEQIEMTALHGRNREMQFTIDGKTDSLYNHTLAMLDRLIEEATINTYKDHLKNLRLKYINQMLDIDVMCKQIEEGKLSLQQFGENNVHLKTKFEMPYPKLNMELSTKLIMKNSEERGFDVSIESESQNIIKVSNGNKSEYLVQGTKTNLDGFANVLIMNDKHITKKILNENGINVPTGVLIQSVEQIPSNLNGEVVVKPLDANFGLGITICDSSNSKQLKSAVTNALKYSDEVIIEKYIKGNEYRFLVIDGKLESIVTRKNANVIGDGKSSVNQLIEIKNKSSLRSRGYKTPLEEIIIDEDLLAIIYEQGFELSTIVPLSQKVILRNTSNVSQGGDSHEVLDIIPNKYRDAAIAATKALGVVICGVDMIIDFETGDYAIIEANYNPALHMHMYPYSGRGRNVADKVLDALFK